MEQKRIFFILSGIVLSLILLVIFDSLVGFGREKRSFLKQDAISHSVSNLQDTKHSISKQGMPIVIKDFSFEVIQAPKEDDQYLKVYGTYENVCSKEISFYRIYADFYLEDGFCMGSEEVANGLFFSPGEHKDLSAKVLVKNTPSFIKLKVQDVAFDRINQ